MLLKRKSELQPQVMRSECDLDAMLAKKSSRHCRSETTNPTAPEVVY